jgi:hypothetical protein
MEPAAYEKFTEALPHLKVALQDADLHKKSFEAWEHKDQDRVETARSILRTFLFANAEMLVTLADMIGSMFCKDCPVLNGGSADCVSICPAPFPALGRMEARYIQLARACEAKDFWSQTSHDEEYHSAQHYSKLMAEFAEEYPQHAIKYEEGKDPVLPP